MKNYVIVVRITAILSFFSFFAIMYIHYYCCGTEADFWCNVCLAIFGSALLTLISSFVGYFTDKETTLAGFSYSTRSLLHVINQYDVNWDLEKKIDFYLAYVDIDKSLWDSQLGMIYFMNDFHKDNFHYIYHSIYKPIIDFNQAVSKHEFHFRWYKDGSGRNDAVMRAFVSELEDLFIRRTTKEQLLDNGEKLCMSSINNCLVTTIVSELNGKYYNLMCNKRNERSEREDT